ncbi:MAG TPA: ferrochelatase [Sporichthyaceae bacterium]|nr:ferrochelatase [Sporichthyaceae bacterium]
MPSPSVAYDAFLLVSFGGPEGPDDVLPFLANVTRGRDVPQARLAEVAEHYLRFGGVSPINEQCRALTAALAAEFAAHGIDLPVGLGNRNWHPMLADTLRTMAAGGVRRVLALVTAAYASYSGCRHYREDLADACAQVGPDAPAIDRIRLYFNHPGFVQPQIDAALAALHRLPVGVRDEAALAFTTHSIPEAMAQSSGPAGGAYVAQHAEVAALVARGVTAATGRAHPWRLVFQSRSGPPSVPWLGPDIGDHLRELAKSATPAVVVSPIGFLSDHVEVCYDLDVEAAAVAAELGLAYARAATVGTAPAFVTAVRELVVERLDPNAPRRTVGGLGAWPDRCLSGCCPNPRGPRPAVGGSD